MLLEAFHRLQELGQVPRLEHLKGLTGKERFTELADVDRNLFLGVEARGDGAVMRLVKNHFAFGEAA